ncbi:MAG TPA: thiamine ABC transporter permease, partial [Lachnoclostridium sp.]|nr:thiamine ABC transporter permease [Lachnoclostridium sp.]
MKQNEMRTGTLLKRFVPYYKKYTKVMVMDLFCASLTTICEMVLPLILRYITNQGLRDITSLTIRTIIVIGALYFGLRIIDGMASFYMAYTGHVMG